MNQQLLERSRKAAAPIVPVTPTTLQFGRWRSDLMPGTLPPAVILGGEANALYHAQPGAQGVKVHVLGTSMLHALVALRTTDRRADGGLGDPDLGAYLLGSSSDQFRGAVLLACSDYGIQLLAKHRTELLAKFRLDLSDPMAQIEVLDKLRTYEHGRAAGVPTPRFWKTTSREQVLAFGHRWSFR